MADFPAGIRCSSLILLAGEFVGSSHASIAGNEITVQANNRPVNARLRVGFRNISAADVASIRNHYNGESTTESWLLSEVLLDGAEYEEDLAAMQWRYLAKPEIKDINADVHDVDFELEHVLEVFWQDRYTLLPKAVCVSVGANIRLTTGVIPEEPEPGPGICLTTVTAEDFEETAGIIYFHDDPEEDYFDLYGEVQQTPADTFTDPVYTYLNYNGTAGQPTVSFGSYFEGQSITNSCGFDSLSACLINAPSSTLALESEAVWEYGTVQTEIAFWYNETPPVLSGGICGAGPISILFNQNVVAVAMKISFWFGTGTVTIKAYDVFGGLLGEVETASISDEGFTFASIAVCDGSAEIRGIQLISENAYAIDNVRFARAGEVTVTPP